jgi:hypothetical protein
MDLDKIKRKEGLEREGLRAGSTEKKRNIPITLGNKKERVGGSLRLKRE